MKRANELMHRIPAWAVVSAAAVCMMTAGILRGEVSTLFAKAVRICLECIGIG